jgi:flavin-dependent dehydrogenase
MRIAATLSAADAAHDLWDVAVVGAGPAGAICAQELARQGVRVLLVDRSEFPRSKVCGGCLSQRGLGVLKRIGLGELPARLGAIDLTEVKLFAGGHCAVVDWRAGVALSRESLDAELVTSAISDGACFLPGTTARLQPAEGDFRELLLGQAENSFAVRARVVIAADGLGGSLTAHSGDPAATIASGSRIGAGCTFESAEAAISEGTVFMSCGRAGYVGLVRLEDGRLNCAAALDRDAVQRLGGPANAAAMVIQEAGLRVPDGLVAATWRGTPGLTRRRRVWGERLLMIGDSAGYREPFTGEGMGWAMESALAATPLVVQAIREWTPRIGETWSRAHQRVIRDRLLRSFAFVLRRPRLARAVVAAAARCPRVVRPAVHLLRRRSMSSATIHRSSSLAR